MKTFAEIAVGDKFLYSGAEYKRIEDVRVSCCKVVNCVSIADGSNQYVPPNSNVEEVNG